MGFDIANWIQFLLMAPMQLKSHWLVGSVQPYVIHIWEANTQISQSSPQTCSQRTCTGSPSLLYESVMAKFQREIVTLIPSGIAS